MGCFEKPWKRLDLLHESAKKIGDMDLLPAGGQERQRERERERESKSRKEGTNLHKKGQLICQHLGHIFSFTPLEFLDEV